MKGLIMKAKGSSVVTTSRLILTRSPQEGQLASLLERAVKHWCRFQTLSRAAQERVSCASHGTLH